MYEEYFSLSGSPFKLNPDPKFFFGSRSHNKAMAYLHYGLKQAEGFIVITGPIGSGKTMVISQLLDQLRESNILAAQLLTSNIAPDELLDHILSAFRIEPAAEGRTGKLEAFEDYLFDQLNRGRRVLLIMDEAQNLPFDTLEELRMLSNLDYDGTPLFQVFLVGQPEFRETMQSSRLEQLRQRVIASYHLENLTADETREYIMHRLAVAGWRADPAFTEAAFEKIFEETEGRPRRINTVANRLLLYCSLEDVHEVTGEVAASVIAELYEESLQAQGKGDGAALDETPPPPMAMPPVRKVDDEPLEQRNVAGSDVVVPFQGRRHSVEIKQGRSEDKLESDLGEKPMQHDVDLGMDTQAAKKAASAEAPKFSGSVFDRLRAKRSSEDDAPEPATLADVASAIATASSKAAVPVAEGAPEETPAHDARDDDAPLAPLRNAPSKEWRMQVRRSLNETRDELKEAHASVGRLRKSFGEMQRRRGEHREKILDGITRAETLLEDLQKSWR